jgi:hypothetical protein
MMNDHIQQTIRTLEQEIEAIDQRRGDLMRAIDALRPLAGASVATVMPRNGNGHPGNGHVSLDDRILAFLRTYGPMKPKALAKSAKLKALELRKHLKAMAKSGLVELTGSTMNRQVSLPRKAAAKEAI